MSEAFDVEREWPELFATLNDEQRRRVRELLSAAWHGGRTPARETVAVLIEFEQGKISEDEFARRSRPGLP